MQIPNPSPLPRISWRSIGADLLQQLNLERGIGYTIRQLIAAPEAAMREYLFENRRRFIKPFPFLLLTVGIATFMSVRYLPVGDALLAEMKKDGDFAQIPESARPVLEWVAMATKKYFNLLYMSTLPGVTLATYWVFRKSRLMLPEHLVINVYLFCLQTLIYLPFIPFATAYPWTAFLQAGLILGYLFYAYLRIFEQPLWPGLWRVFLVQLIAQVFYAVVVSLLASLAWYFFNR